MSYLIQAFTFDSPVPKDSGYPWANTIEIPFADASESRIYLADEGHAFKPVNWANYYQLPGQKLTEDIALGEGETIGAGAILTYKAGTVSEIADRDGNLYFVFAPHISDGESYDIQAVGGDRTIFVIADKGSPPLDPSLRYDWMGPFSRPSIPTNHSEPPTAPCFATGTLIATANGMRAVETLVAGDLVRTRDRGLRPVAWAGGRHLPARELDAAPHLRPILIRAGALGPGLPAHDLNVSPQHRVLIHSKIAARLVGQAEALVAAKHLTGLPGIAVLNPGGGIGYHHLLFDRHELVWSNGCWTESLFTGPQAMAALGSAARREIRAILPQLFDGTAPTGARQFLTGREGRELTRRHLKHGRALVMQADD
ncbi:Hint domain-containing protein [Paracoccus jeotgali]|uniref:Hint domain-containing protein n=1 Tax=Paracoccus jeotgali TaxID=2065379 RepID=UPI0028AFED7A|nr:Hint domain-containing protein [Paracoccus jeotgali]